jgi:methylated-DNA-[protein]-cysteine S-methyltransferase
MTHATAYTIHPSPLGDLLLTMGDGGLTGVYMHAHDPRPLPGCARDEAPFAAATAQLDEYFAGERTTFDLRLAPSGTPFELRVWDELKRIPYGQTTTYGELARLLGRPGAARAVGRANGRNPISIVVPCHRVIGASGALTGYAGGLERKQALLALEGAAMEAGTPAMSLTCTPGLKDHGVLRNGL